MKYSFLILLIIWLPAIAQVSTIENYCSSLAANDQFNGSILVAEKGRVVYERSFGYANFEKGIKNSERTAFPIASISKTITATAILQLAHAGKLRVTDAVTKHLPWFPY